MGIDLAMISSVILFFIVFCLSLVGGYFYKKSKNGISRFIGFLIIVIPPILLSAFRYGVGTDYFGYLESFNSIKAYTSYSTFYNYYQEPLWVLVNLFSKDYSGVLLISSIIYTFFITIAILRYQKSIGVVFPLFISYMVFYCLSFNGIRQSLAAAIVLYAITFLREKRADSQYMPFIFFVVLAGLFHKSAFICLLFLVVYFDRRYRVFQILADIVIISLGVVVLSSFFRFIFSYFHLYSSYLESQSTGRVGFFLYIIPVVILVIIAYFRNKTGNRSFLFLFKVYLLQIPFQVLGVFISYADRIAIYGLISQVFLVPLVIKNMKNKREKTVFYFTFTCWYIFYFIIMFVVLRANGVFPFMYKFD